MPLAALISDRRKSLQSGARARVRAMVLGLRQWYLYHHTFLISRRRQTFPTDDKIANTSVCYSEGTKLV